MNNLFSKKRLIAILHSTIFFISILLMLYIALKQWQVLQKTGWSFQYYLFIPSVIGVAILLLLCVYGWHFILLVLGQKLPFKTSLFIWSISFPTRYIPGGIWSYTNRASLARTKGIKIIPAIFSMYIETLLVIISSATIGIIAFFLLVINFPIKIEIVLAIWSSAFLLLHPKIIAQLLKKIIKDTDVIENIRLINIKKTFKLFFYYVFYWIVCGGFFVLFVSSIYPLNYKDWIPVGASFALCYFIGFIVFFVPSGIGIRESALYITLSPILPDDINLLVSTGSRLWLMAGEILFLFIAFLLNMALDSNPCKPFFQTGRARKRD